MALLNFNAANVAPATPREPIPGGWYDAKVTDSNVTPTKDGTGLRLNLTFTVIGGQFDGRKVFEGLNIKNKSEKAQQIAHEQLSAICHAVGILDLKQSEQLHGHPLKIKVKVRPEQDGYEARNEINGYENIAKSAGGTAAPGATGVQRPAANAAAGAARPAGFGGGANARPATSAPNGARPTGTAAASQARPAVQQRPAQQAPAQQAAPAQNQVAAQATGVDQPWEGEQVDENGQYVEQAGEFVQDGGQVGDDAPWGAE